MYNTIPPAGFPQIRNDEIIKVQAELSALSDTVAAKQDATDNNLETTSKTVVGAVNELKSGLTNYQTQNDLNLEVPDRKNLLPLAIEEVKKSSTTGTWSGNNYTVNGVTFAVITDENGVVTSVNATGTASADAVLVVSRDIKLDAGNYIMNGCPSGGSSSTYEQYITTPYTEDVGNGSDFTITSQNPTFAIKIVNGYEIPSGGVTFYPMIRLASITDPTFAPYIPSVESRIEAVESVVKNTHYEKVIENNVWYKIGEMTIGSYAWLIHRILMGVIGSNIKSIGLRATPTDGFNNNENVINKIYGTMDALGLRFTNDYKTVELYLKTNLTGFTSYTVLSEDTERTVNVSWQAPARTQLTDSDMAVIG